jgi:MFS family permease
MGVEAERKGTLPPGPELPRADEGLPVTAEAESGERLGRRRNLTVMLAIVLLVGLGEELWVRFLPQYLEGVGGGVWAVAAYGTLYNLLDALYQYPGGWLADRLGRRKALAAFTLAAAGGYLLYLLPGWEWVLLGTFLVMAWDSLTLPGLFAVVADNLPPNRRATGFGVLSVVRRVPTIVAPPLGGLLIGALGLAAGVQAGLAVTVALALLAAALVGCCYRESCPHPHEPVRFGGLWHGLDGRLKRLLAADVLSRWAEGLPRVFVVLYCLGPLGLSPWQFGWLVAVQRGTNVLAYLVLAPLSDRMNRRPFVLVTFLFFALAPLALVNAKGFAEALAAFAVAGLCEVGEPARKALIVDLAHSAVRGRAVGLYYLVRNLAVFPAAMVGGLLWDTAGPKAVFYTAGAVGLAGLAFYAAWGAGTEATPDAGRRGGGT